MTRLWRAGHRTSDLLLSVAKSRSARGEGTHVRMIGLAWAQGALGKQEVIAAKGASVHVVTHRVGVGELGGRCCCPECWGSLCSPDEVACLSLL